MAKDEQVFEDFVEQFGEYEQEKEEYREILRQEKKGGDKVQEKGRKARRKRNKPQESAKGESPEMKKDVWKRLLTREIEDGAHGIHNIV